MVSIRECFESLRIGKSLTSTQLDLLGNHDLSQEQCASALAALSIKLKPSKKEMSLKKSLAAKAAKLAFLADSEWLSNAHLIAQNLTDTENYWLKSFINLCSQQRLGEQLINDLVQNIKSSSNHMFTSAFLMFVCRLGMQDDDLVFLTKSMANSGPIYDYRNNSQLNNAKIVRRYPTGALSEKTALILPALIATAREVVNVASPFLVAKSLGFTGGTWDKLSSINNFKFPSPGEETIEALKKCGVAMTVTLDDINPVDRILYQLRSVTGTIESHPLIISSIASKHISIPIDRLLMDIRYGEGAFLSNKNEATDLGNKLIKILNDNNVPSFYELTDTDQPTGSAIGNSIELAEAIEIMSGKSTGLFNTDSIQLQKNLVIHFFGLLMASEFTNLAYDYWTQFAILRFNDSSVLASFKQILIAHNVCDSDATKITFDPIDFFNLLNKVVDIRSDQSGYLKKIHQKNLGEIVYTRMGGANNQFSGKFNPNNGIVIFPRIGDKINSGDILAKLIYEKNDDAELLKLVNSCFLIE